MKDSNDNEPGNKPAGTDKSAEMLMNEYRATAVRAQEIEVTLTKLGVKSGPTSPSLPPTKIIKSKIRQIKQAAGENGSGLSMSELMGFFSTLIGPDSDETIPQSIKDFADTLIRFRRGEKQKQSMMNALYKLYETVPTGEKAKSPEPASESKLPLRTIRP